MDLYRAGIPLCELCAKCPPDHTHHVLPLSLGGADEEFNYLAVCLACHEKLHPELPQTLKDKWRQPFKGKTKKEVVAKVELSEISLLEALEELGWSQAKLARHIDVSNSTVNRWTRSKMPKVVMMFLTLLIDIRRLVADNI